jgi:transposase
MLRELMEDLEFVERKIERMQQAIVPQPSLEQVARLCTIPGVDVVTAWTILAELGSEMRVFSSPKHAARWAGLCPGVRFPPDSAKEISGDKPTYRS